jgi:hypothetical protein
MKVLNILSCLSVMVLLLSKAVTFHKATICRQKAWQKSFDLTTRNLLSSPASQEIAFLKDCRIYIRRNEDKVSWQTYQNLKANTFSLPLKGKL